MAENLGGWGAGGLEPLHFLKWGTEPPTSDSNEFHYMKLFNNLIKNTFLAPMFCGLVKS